jgi:uncharacterized protein YndB with AHSA1/START domain
MIVETIEIDRPPEEVFAYLDDLDRHSEWQNDLVTSRKVTDGPVGVGTRAVDNRKVPGGPRDFTYEVTEHDPPRRSSFKGIDGPVRPVGTVTIEPLDDGKRSRVRLEFDLVGHGIGKLFAPLARMQARKQIPKDQQTLKQRLESGAAGGATPAAGTPAP